MPRAASLSKASAVNRKKAGSGSGGRAGGVNLPNLPTFNGPPAGTFDPGLEAQVRAAERGLLDLIEKTRLEGRRESHDTREARILLERKVRQGRSDIDRNRGYAIKDAGTQREGLGVNFARDLQDLAIAKQRGEEDYQKALTDMQHRYARIGAEQSQASVSQGTDSVGVEAASAAVRGANQSADKSEVDTAHRRAEEALALEDARTREDLARRLGLVDEGLGRELTGYGVQAHRLGLDQRTQRNRLHLEAARNRLDRRTNLSHAKREYGIYATDVAQQAYYQAHQLNPNIIFPSSAAGAPGAPRPHRPAIGGGLTAPRAASGVGVGSGARALNRGVGLHPAVSYHRRPYTRY